MIQQLLKNEVDALFPDVAKTDQAYHPRPRDIQNYIQSALAKDQYSAIDEDNLSVCLFVCGISLTSGQLVSELFPDCTRSCFSQVVSRGRGGECIYEMKCLFVAVGPNARFIVLPHWDNMS